MGGTEHWPEGPSDNPENLRDKLRFLFETLLNPDNGMKFLHADASPYTEEEMDELWLEKAQREINRERETDN